MRLFPVGSFVALCVLVTSAAASFGQSHTLSVVPRAKAAPAIDGSLTDPAWASALVLSDFTVPESTDKPGKAVEAHILFDDANIYLAVHCQEPTPAGIATVVSRENADVWMDDCIEVFIRTGHDGAEHDQFIANARGVRGWQRVRSAGIVDEWSPSFKVTSVIGKDYWNAVFTIPFKDLGVSAPRRGDMFEMKIGRHVAAGDSYSTWPAGRYGGNEDYANVYFESANLLANPGLTLKDGKIAGWSFDPALAAMFHTPPARSGADLVIDCPGKRVALSQQMKLEPGAVYRLDAWTRGSSCLLSSISTDEKGTPTRENVLADPCDNFQLTTLPVTVGSDGKVSIIFGPNEGSPRGKVEIADLRLRRDASYPTVGPCIAVHADAPGPLVVTKLMIADCRAQRGFMGIPVDGTTQSWGWDYRYTEYNRHDYGAGVDYHHKGNDGLHIKFADDKSEFNAVVVRGGVKADFYHDCTDPESAPPTSDNLLAHLKGMTRDTTRLWFNTPVKTNSVSFFNVSDGYIADLSFFDVNQDQAGLPAPQQWKLTAEKTDLPRMLQQRFAAGNQKAFRLAQPTAPESIGGKLDLEANQFVHFIIPAIDSELPLAAVGIDFKVPGDAQAIAFTARVQDSVDLQRELCGADFQLDRAGRAHLILKFPNQILPRDFPVVVSLRFEKNVHLDDACVDLYVVDRATAAPQALAYRKFLFHSMFVCLSEARPWYNWPNSEKEVKEWLKKNKPENNCVREMVEALDYCRHIGLADPEIQTYYEWIWHTPLRKENKLPAFTPKLDAPAGAPQWAALAHQAWLAWREVPQWWLEHRVNSAGEFGGDFGDDHNMYQNYKPFPMFENDGVAADLKKSAAAMAEFGRQRITDGVNKYSTDPLHAYEQGINQESLVTLWNYGDPVYFERCMEAASSVEQLTVMTSKGHRHFRTQEISAAKRNDPHTDIDGQAHPNFLDPVFEVARYNRNPTVMKFLREWGDGWLEHEKKGEYASKVEVATEKVVASSTVPFTGGGDDGGDAGYGSQASGFYSMFLATGDAKYLEPFFDIVRADDLDRIESIMLPTGVIHDLYNSGVLDKFANLPEIAKHNGVVAAELTGDKTLLCRELTASIAEIQRYKMIYTYAEVFPDRVFLIEPFCIVSQTYTGGYASRNRFNYTFAVSYEGFGTDYAALVMKNRADALKVLIYNFSDKPLKGRLRPWSLDHGQYKITCGVDTTGKDVADKIDREENLEILHGSSVEVTLPPKQTTVIELVQTLKLDDERLRADLAISALDSKVTGSVAEGFVHNIGAKEASAVEVALVNPQGKIIQRKDLGALAAPLDLVARKRPFKFEGLPGDVKGWSIVIDPENNLEEIYKGNNRLVLP